MINEIGKITEMIDADHPTILHLLTNQDRDHHIPDCQMHQFHHHLGDIVNLPIHTTTKTISPTTTTMLTSIDNTM